MNIEIKISKKPVNYEKAIKYMEKRLNDILFKNSKDLIWILQNNDIYNAGPSYNDAFVQEGFPLKGLFESGAIYAMGLGVAPYERLTHLVMQL